MRCPRRWQSKAVNTRPLVIPTRRQCQTRSLQASNHERLAVTIRWQETVWMKLVLPLVLAIPHKKIAQRVQVVTSGDSQSSNFRLCRTFSNNPHRTGLFGTGRVRVVCQAYEFLSGHYYCAHVNVLLHRNRRCDFQKDKNSAAAIMRVLIQK